MLVRAPASQADRVLRLGRALVAGIDADSSDEEILRYRSVYDSELNRQSHCPHTPLRRSTTSPGAQRWMPSRSLRGGAPSSGEAREGKTALMGKYDGLRDHLHHSRDDAVEMTFNAVADLVGGLPPSASNYRGWWANDSKVQAQAWRAAGFHVERVTLERWQVRFERGERGGTFRERKLGELDALMPMSTIPPWPPVAVERTWPWEGVVQSVFVAALRVVGWTIQAEANTATKERGVDVLAIRGDRSLGAEVKGLPSVGYADPRRTGERKPTRPSTQAGHLFAAALLAAMRLHENVPAKESLMVLPAEDCYRSIAASTRTARDGVGVQVVLVNADGSLESETWSPYS